MKKSLFEIAEELDGENGVDSDETSVIFDYITKEPNEGEQDNVKVIDKIFAEIPKNMQDYLKKYYANISINYNVTDGLNGYGQIMNRNVIVYRYHEWCNRCGWSNLFGKERWDIKPYHYRHTIERDYSPVFAWTDFKNEKSLEECFADFLSTQGGENENIHQRFYGEF